MAETHEDSYEHPDLLSAQYVCCSLLMVSTVIHSEHHLHFRYPLQAYTKALRPGHEAAQIHTNTKKCVCHCSHHVAQGLMLPPSKRQQWNKLEASATVSCRMQARRSRYQQDQRTSRIVMRTWKQKVPSGTAQAGCAVPLAHVVAPSCHEEHPGKSISPRYIPGLF